MYGFLGRFVRSEMAGGALLFAMGATALVWANVGSTYAAVTSMVVLGHTIPEVVNDWLMALFFFVVGMEIKRELIAGELSSVSRAMLPAIAALGGMVVPAVIYLALNPHGVATRGWGVPVATDIAFVVGALALLGRRVPRALAVFIVALAVFDDIGGIAVIAVGYGGGVHITVFGVVVALFVPRRFLERFIDALHPIQTVAVLPLFALMNAGVDLRGVSLSALASPVTIGTALGLFVGKQVGIFGSTWLAVRLRIAKLPTASSWTQVYGVSVLAGIGFTVALFIADIAFTGDLLSLAKVGIIAGSLISGIVGYLLLRTQKAPTGAP